MVMLFMSNPAGSKLGTLDKASFDMTQWEPSGPMYDDDARTAYTKSAATTREHDRR